MTLHEEWITTGGATHRGGRGYVRDVLSRGAAVRTYPTALHKRRPGIAAEHRPPDTAHS